MKAWVGTGITAFIVVGGAMPAEAAAKPPAVAAGGYVVVDAGSGQILAAKNPDGRYLPASTIKTLTAVTVIPKVRPSTRVKPGSQAVNAVPIKVGLRPSRTYRMDDLLRAALMKSANDAAFALTQPTGGLKPTLALMNAEAKRLGAKNTLAGSPNGLDRDYGLTVRTQHTTAHDLAVIFRAGLKLPDFRRYVGTRKASFPGGGTLTNGSFLSGVPGMIGGKNGATRAAGKSYVGAAQRNGRTIIVAQLGSGPSVYSDTRKLFAWAFANAGKVKPVGTLAGPAPAKAPVPAKSAQQAAASEPPAGGKKKKADLRWGWFLMPVLVGGLGYAVRRRTSS